MRIADFGPFSTKVIAAVLIVSGSCVLYFLQVLVVNNEMNAIAYLSIAETITNMVDKVFRTKRE